MERVPIAQLRPSTRVEGVYYLEEMELRTKKNGEPFASLKLRDATGSAPAVMWEGLNPLLSRQVNPEDFVRIRGEVSLYNNAPQIIVSRIEKVADEEVNFADFIPSTPCDRAALERELDERIAEVRNPDCRRLLEYFFGAGPASVRRAFCEAPAAAKVHQAYLGGLLEHTLAVLRNALLLAPNYQPCDRDALITGALLHDLGKIREFEWRRVIRYTDEGRLVGHITIAAGMVQNALRELAPFDERLGWNLLHILISHHGKLEYGSPVTPKTREAILLHQADWTDAYMDIYSQETARARELGQTWTPYNRLFETWLYAGPIQGAPAAPGGGESSGEDLFPAGPSGPVEG